MAICEPGADFPEDCDRKLKQLAELGIVDQVEESSAGAAVRSLRLRGYYATLVLRWVNKDGTVRVEPFAPDVSDQMLIRLVEAAGKIEHWLERKDHERLRKAEEALKPVYTKHRGKELKCKEDWLDWAEFVATFNANKPQTLKTWPGQFKEYPHVAATRQWRHPFAHVRSTQQLKQLAQLLPPFINELLLTVKQLDETESTKTNN